MTFNEQFIFLVFDFPLITGIFILIVGIIGSLGVRK